MKPVYLLIAMLATTSSALAQNLNLASGPGGGTPPIQITASGGVEWSQKTNTVTASGDTKAVRGDVTVTADQLIAHYGPQKTAPSTASSSNNGLLGQGNNQLTELDAIGHVHIYTATQNAWSDRAVYSADQQVLVLTGKHLKLTTPTDTLTARDSIEYYAGAHKAVARGDAHITSTDGRSISANVITGYFSTQPGGNNQQSLEKVEAFGNVVITTPSDVASGNSGVYIPSTGKARLGGDVHITHKGNHLSGSDALVNMKAGTATLLASPGGRVSGVILPGTGKAQ